MELKLYEGRPQTNEGRQDKEIRVYDLLDELEISFQRTDHEVTNTMEACNEIDKILEVLI